MAKSPRRPKTPATTTKKSSKKTRASKKPSTRRTPSTPPLDLPPEFLILPDEADPLLAADDRLSEIELHRRALRLSARREVQSRIDDYFQSLPPTTRDLPPAPSLAERRRRATRAGARPAAAPRRIRIIAEGDSWFDYPWFLLRAGGVIPRLASRLYDHLIAEDILNLAHYGHEVRQMLGVTQREDLIRCLQKSNFDAILFSGGGNDIVGDQLTLWLKHKSDANGPADALRPAIFQSVVNIVLQGYDDLLQIRDDYAPGAAVFVHAYSLPYPQNKGVCGIGPWLFPSMIHRDWTEAPDQIAIAAAMLQSFGNQLQAWAATKQNVVYVPTLDLDIKPHNWHNEIHPDSDGFNQVADLFAQTIRAHFGL